jgi:phosphohistidine phosphatase
MRTLLLLRHGKSDWNAAYESDHERPLAKRGTKAARLVGRYLTAIEQQPDLVVTSSAVRARSTAELAAESGAWSCPLRMEDRLYGADPAASLDVVQKIGDDVERLLIVGHEPCWSLLVGWLTGGSRVRFPTAALTAVAFEQTRWSEVEDGLGELQWLVTPRILSPVMTG